MTTLARSKTRPTYRQVLQAVKALSPDEQRRLRDDLAKLAGVQLVRPTGAPTAVRRGRQLAKKIQVELSASTETLDDAMLRLRGQSWSP